MKSGGQSRTPATRSLGYVMNTPKLSSFETVFFTPESVVWAVLGRDSSLFCSEVAPTGPRGLERWPAWPSAAQTTQKGDRSEPPPYSQRDPAGQDSTWRASRVPRAPSPSPVRSPEAEEFGVCLRVRGSVEGTCEAAVPTGTEGGFCRAGLRP